MLNGKRHGKGKQYYKDGTLDYEGQYQDGAVTGTGKLHRTSGTL